MSWKLSLGRLLPTFGLALAAWAAVPAQAAVVVASFDPAFGAAIPNLGFRGTAQFSIADACFAQNGLVLDGDACSGNTMQVLQASVEFYNLADPATTLLTTTWSGASFDVLAAAFSGGQLVGIDTNISVPTAVVIAQGGPQPVNFNGYMALQFFSGQMGGGGGGGGEDEDGCDPFQVGGGSSQEPASGSATGGTRLFTCAVDSGASCSVQAESNAATVSYQTVPEPASALLALLALGAAATAGRRTRRA